MAGGESQVGCGTVVREPEPLRCRPWSCHCPPSTACTRSRHRRANRSRPCRLCGWPTVSRSGWCWSRPSWTRPSSGGSGWSARSSRRSSATDRPGHRAAGDRPRDRRSGAAAPRPPRPFSRPSTGGPGPACPQVPRRQSRRERRHHAGRPRRVSIALAENRPSSFSNSAATTDLRGIPLAITQANLAQMIEAFQGGGARVVLAGMSLPPNYGSRSSRSSKRCTRTWRRNIA